MSVYIKGMEMPTSCHECVAGYGGCCYVAPADADGICPDHGRADFCPLVPVPDHGDLIDRHDIKNKEITIDYDGWDDTFEDGLLFVADLIDNAPTIIPASKEGEG